MTYYHIPIQIADYTATLVSDETALRELLWPGQPSALVEGLIGGETFGPDVTDSRTSLPPVMTAARTWLAVYLSGEDPGPPPPLEADGTPFRREVWELLLTIPYGETRTYGELAAVLAERRGIPRMAAQAVGGAVGANPLSIFIPCHRVVGADGSLTGYGGGLAIKAELLRLEQGGTGAETTGSAASD